MRRFFSQVWRPLLRPLLVFSLVATLIFSNAGSALALGRGGGRIGGGGFSVPSRSYTSRPAPSYGGGGYYPGGGIGFPLVWGPIFFGGGAGSLFTILIFLSIASFIVRSFRASQSEDLSGGYGDLGYGAATPTVSVSKVQVGLLSSARGLQADLDRLAKTADTGSKEGLTEALQETTLALLRHPEYWVYGGSQSAQHRLEAAEAQFNRLALAERSKFSEETLSNVNRQLRQAESTPAALAMTGTGELVATEQPTEIQPQGEYIVVTLLAATLGKLDLPVVNSTEDLRRALSQMGAVSSDRLLALEILWTPQVEGQTLSSDELVAEYADLRLV
ncbi:MAG: DUF1517 domain-containing protein [Elainellaceae cyanobacterium]